MASWAGRSVERHARLADEPIEYWRVPHSVFPATGDGLPHTTQAGEQLDAPAGLLSNVRDLHQLATAIIRGDFLHTESGE
jgi:hypothetical protein